VKSIFAADVHPILERLSSEKVMFMRSRATVHCDLKDFDESVVRNIKCSRSSPCLFDLHEDPCEFDNKREHEFDFRRDHMRNIFERYLTKGIFDETSVKSVEPLAEGKLGVDDSTMVGIILGGSVVGCIFIFIVVVCFKEKCNRRRSVYHDTSIKKKAGKSSDEQTGNGTTMNGMRKGEKDISIISRSEL